MFRPRQFLLGFLAAVSVIFTIVSGFYAYQTFKEFQLLRAQHAAIINYLAAPTGKTNDKGEVITRADVLAAIAQKAIDVGNNPPVAPKSAGTP